MAGKKSERRAFLAGLTVGAFLSLAVLLAGTLILLPGVIVIAWLIARQPPVTAAAGALIGSGATWLLVIGQATWRCAQDPSCGQPDMTGLLAFGAALLVAGVAVRLLAMRRYRQT